MMISTKGRYALRVMIDLAERPDDRYHPLKEIADRQGISEKYLESIVKTLVRHGLLAGLRGKGGGYRLARPVSEYTVGSILRLREGSLAPVSCLDHSSSESQCARRENCRTFPMWQNLDQLIQDYLDGITLMDLLSPCQEPAENKVSSIE